MKGDGRGWEEMGGEIGEGGCGYGLDGGMPGRGVVAKSATTVEATPPSRRNP